MSLGKLTDKIRPFDAFSKTLDEIRIQTFSGGIVTIICTTIMILLFISEFHHYQTLKVTETLYVDVSRSGKLRINLDITFFRISCGFLNVDIMDSSGERMSSVEKTITKHRTDMLGTQLEDKPTEVVQAGIVSKDTCGSCYGAEKGSRECCNSCEDIISAYMEMGWALKSTEEFEQCKREQNEKHISINKEGCRLTGYVEVNKIQGNMHIAPGNTFGAASGGHSHVHNLIPFEAKDVNTSHLIHHFSFGENYPGRVDPMDDIEATAGAEGAMMFSYYTKIVPTMYHSITNSTTRTYQYSVTTHKRSLTRAGGSMEKGLPGMFVYYELSPIMVQMEEQYRSTAHFLTSVCAIIGGLFTVAGIVDSLIYHTQRVIQRQLHGEKAI